ncbi:hypothetical protein KFK09_023540 [Dendrobium nobile]|uniref:Uncharacterized protein n=1 Tax=Dendrobium nobile TaxID=94219 RepID=A0A8T3ABK0_DENNO|nr:hypothetical protein KFK09_023540 [Dendrobium nobile]
MSVSLSLVWILYIKRITSVNVIGKKFMNDVMRLQVLREDIFCLYSCQLFNNA